jgi:hypothetical protein
MESDEDDLRMVHGAVSAEARGRRSAARIPAQVARRNGEGHRAVATRAATVQEALGLIKARPIVHPAALGPGSSLDKRRRFRAIEGGGEALWLPTGCVESPGRSGA